MLILPIPSHASSYSHQGEQSSTNCILKQLNVIFIMWSEWLLPSAELHAWVGHGRNAQGYVWKVSSLKQQNLKLQSFSSVDEAQHCNMSISIIQLGQSWMLTMAALVFSFVAHCIPKLITNTCYKLVKVKNWRSGRNISKLWMFYLPRQIRSCNINTIVTLNEGYYLWTQHKKHIHHLKPIYSIQLDIAHKSGELLSELRVKVMMEKWA